MNEQRRRREPSPSLRGKYDRKSGLTEETKVSSFFWKFLPGGSIHSCPGGSIRLLPGLFQFFPILTFKGSLPFFSKFYRSWKLRFRFPIISCALPGIYKFSTSWKECRFLPFTTNFSQRKKFPKIYKNVSSWETLLLPNFTEAGKINLPLFSISFQ